MALDALKLRSCYFKSELHIYINISTYFHFNVNIFITKIRDLLYLFFYLKKCFLRSIRNIVVTPVWTKTNLMAFDS